MMYSGEAPPAAIDESARSRILRERARMLALRPDEEETEHWDILEFTISGEGYGVELGFVSEVYSLVGLTPIPCAPRFVLGVVSIRGKIFSVIDFRSLLMLASSEPALSDKVIIIGDGSMEFGIRAESIVGSQAIPNARIRKGLPTISGIGADYLKGVTDGQVAIIDCANMLGDAKLIVHEDVAQ